MKESSCRKQVTYHDNHNSSKTKPICIPKEQKYIARDLSTSGKMIETITKTKYGIAIMADLEGAFDSVWSLGALYKLHKARISENLLLIFASFMRNHQQRNLVNTHIYMSGQHQKLGFGKGPY